MCFLLYFFFFIVFVFFQAEDGIRDLVRSRGLGDVYKRQGLYNVIMEHARGKIPFKTANPHLRSQISLC